MVIDGVDFGLYQPDIFEYLRDGQPGILGDEWFRTAIAFAYRQIAESYGCDAWMSAARTDEARLFWKRDVGRIDIDGDTTPDHFKQAGFLAYWLRRRLALNHVVRREHSECDDNLRTKFVMSGNELCAFLVGFRICTFFEYGRLAEEGQAIDELIQRINVSPSLLFDIAALMKNKNVSPHAIYVVYRSLFHNIELPERSLRAVPIR